MVKGFYGKPGEIVEKTFTAEELAEMARAAQPEKSAKPFKRVSGIRIVDQGTKR